MIRLVLFTPRRLTLPVYTHTSIMWYQLMNDPRQFLRRQRARPFSFLDRECESSVEHAAVSVRILSCGLFLRGFSYQYRLQNGGRGR